MEVNHIKKNILCKAIVLVSVFSAGLISQTTETFAQSNQTIITERPIEIEPITAPFKMPQLKRPQFSNKTFNILEYGAKNDGTTKNTKAFRKAIEACSAAGGGKVLVPAGKWLTGAIHLESNVNLHFEEGAELHFSDDPDDYLPIVFTRWAGIELYNYSPLIYANNCENIAITGPGKLFGHGEKWWDWTWRGEKTARFVYENKVLQYVPPEQRIYGTPEAGLRPQFINPVNCKNVLFEGFSIGAPGPFWTFDILYCENVIVRGLKLETVGGPNNDGINLNSTKNALVEFCHINAGDDCIVLKSGINEDGWRVGRPTENVVIRNITGYHSHGGIVIGSDMSGDVRNIFAHNCQFQGADRGIRLKSNASRGGIVENIYYKNIKMENIKYEAIIINTNYGAYMASDNGKAYPVFRNISISNVTCDSADVAINMQGTSHQMIENITLENIDIKAINGMTFNWVNGLVLKNVQYERIKKPITPPNALFTHSHKPGLEAEYYNNKDLKGEPVYTRIDRQINFYYSPGNPSAPGVNPSKFSVRWKGLLKAPKSGTYKIGLEADDGFRLYLDNKLIIDAWENYKKGTFKGVDIQLEQDEFYDLKIEYYEDLGFGYALLKFVQQD